MVDEPCVNQASSRQNGFPMQHVAGPDSACDPDPRVMILENAGYRLEWREQVWVEVRGSLDNESWLGHGADRNHALDNLLEHMLPSRLGSMLLLNSISSRVDGQTSNENLQDAITVDLPEVIPGGLDLGDPDTDTRLAIHIDPASGIVEVDCATDGAPEPSSGQTTDPSSSTILPLELEDPSLSPDIRSLESMRKEIEIQTQRLYISSHWLVLAKIRAWITRA